MTIGLVILRKAIFAYALAVAGCAPVGIAVAAPRLVWVAPDVWLVENHPYAVYYVDGYYWRYAGGVWSQSLFYDRGFVRVSAAIVPRIVVGAYRPVHAYFRPPVRVHSRPIVRDHRARRPRPRL